MRSSSALLVVGIAGVFAFSPLLAGGFEFVNWDDLVNIVQHPIMAEGSRQGLLSAWTSVALGVYEPLSVTLKVVLVRSFGMQVQPFHVVSLALHIANACLLFLLARRLMHHCDEDLRSKLRPDAAALLAALLFVLNPTCVESVAWASGQPYALAGCFFLISTLCYVRYVEACGADVGNGRRAVLFSASLLFYVCAVFGKSAAIFLPAVLLLLDGYPLRRRISARWIGEKVLFFGMGGVLTATIIHFTGDHQGVRSFDLELPARMAYALAAIPFHLGNALWPAELLPAYPVSRADVSFFDQELILQQAAAIATIAVACGAWRLAPWLSVSIGIYLAGILPTSPLFTHGDWILGADRYGYMSLIGIWIVLGAALTSARVVPRAAFADTRARSVGSCVLAVLSIWGLLTWQQVQHWRSSESLWRYTLERNPSHRIGLNNLGYSRMLQKRYSEALPFLRGAVQVDPGNLKPVLNLGVSLVELGRPQEALRVYRAALPNHGNSAAVHNNMANAYAMLGQRQPEDEHRRRARELRGKP